MRMSKYTEIHLSVENDFHIFNIPLYLGTSLELDAWAIASDLAPHIDVLISELGPAGLMTEIWMARWEINARIFWQEMHPDFQRVRTGEFTEPQTSSWTNTSFAIFKQTGFVAPKKSSTYLTLKIEYGRKAIMCLRFACGTQIQKERWEYRIEYRILFLASKRGCLFLDRIDHFFLDPLQEHREIKVERGVLPENPTFDESKAESEQHIPSKLFLQHLSADLVNPDQNQATVDRAAIADGLFRNNIAPDDTDEISSKAHKVALVGMSETAKLKYILGCDGAHSWTRRQLRYQLDGE